MDRSHALIALGLAGCAPGQSSASIDALGTLAVVLEAPTASDAPFHDPVAAENGVRGGGAERGSLDVFSLGLGPDEGVVLGFDPPVVDAPGPDLAVFENPFEVAGGGRFFDPVVVEVSSDCESYIVFPHHAPPGDGFADPTGWVGFAGITPVWLHEEELPLDPLSEAAGGDRFDLATLGADAPPEVACVRLTSASGWLGPDGSPFPHDPISDGPDIDGVYAR